MASRRLLALALAAVLVLAACASDLGVSVERVDPIALDGAAPMPTAPDDADEPGGPGATTTVPTPSSSIPSDPAAINRGSGKPPQEYDDFLLAVATDLAVWWSEQYPAIYGETFTPLEGGIYAAFPGRADDIPGCGAPSTTYEEVAEYAAFYCAAGDFIVYDDAEGGLLADLAEEYGPGTIGTVIAHEYGHAIQLRIGALDRSLPTILSEQQADCFAGAWTARAARGEASTLRYRDADVRAGLIAMTKVSDPVGIDQFVEGGHGSGFDRVGAFQVGYSEGAARCAELLDDPLPLVPNEFTGLNELSSGGNARFGYAADELLGFLPDDLNLYWDQELAAEIPGLDELSLVVVQSDDEPPCDDLRGDLSAGSALCVSTNEVIINEPAALELYRSLGDFSVGYLLGLAWGEAVQVALGSDLDGEERALLNDCLTGGWVKTVIPVDDALPLPRLEERTSVVSAGDLDEAIQTVLLLADDTNTNTNTDNSIGSAFEKIQALRTGVIDGTDTCLAQL